MEETYKLSHFFPKMSQVSLFFILLPLLASPPTTLHASHFLLLHTLKSGEAVNSPIVERLLQPRSQYYVKGIGAML